MIKKAQCPYCGREVTVSIDKYMTSHLNMSGSRCEGSNVLAEKDKPKKKEKVS